MNNPNKNAKMAHVVNLLSISMSDGTVAEKEKNLVFAIAKDFGLSKEEFDQCLTVSQQSLAQGKVVVEVPETDDLKIAFLKNLTLMMMIDGKIDEYEKKYIKIVAEKFGYDGDKALEVLMNSVYADFNAAAENATGGDGTNPTGGGSTQPSGQSNSGGMSKEEFEKETQRLFALGKKAMEEHDIPKAFDCLFYPAHVYGAATNLFFMIFNTYTRIYLLTDKQVALLKDYAERGYAVSQYAYGRYLYFMRTEEESIEKAEKYFKAAEAFGFGDAIQAQSILLLNGYLGLVDIAEGHKMTIRAIEKGSDLAARTYLCRLIYGDAYLEADPQKAIDTIKKMFPYESNEIDEVNPMYYEVLAEAYEKIGNKREAEIYYQKAINMGYVEAFAYYCYLQNQDQSTEEKREAYLEMLEEACEAGDPNGYVFKGAFFMDHFEDYDEATRLTITAEIKESFEIASEMGSSMAPVFLAEAYYYGRYGFKEDDDEAWSWALEGTSRDDGSAYALAAQMLIDGYLSNVINKDFLFYCQLMALRLGQDDQLANVVEAYRKGELTDYAAEIEQYYVPRYEALPKDENEEEEEEEEETNEAEYKLIAIVKTDGKADIVEYEVEGGWDQLPDFVDAKRLDAIRTQPLYDISKQLGLSDHVTAWVDNMGQMKGLPTNDIGCRLYPGPIVGDMILTLEDGGYHPKSFESIEVLKGVLQALGAKLENVFLDDGPDDDGRFDAWA